MTPREVGWARSHLADRSQSHILQRTPRPSSGRPATALLSNITPAEPGKHSRADVPQAYDRAIIDRIAGSGQIATPRPARQNGARDVGEAGCVARAVGGELDTAPLSAPTGLALTHAVRPNVAREGRGMRHITDMGARLIHTGIACNTRGVGKIACVVFIGDMWGEYEQVPRSVGIGSLGFRHENRCGV